MILDVPLYAIQTLVFSAILYFLVGLSATATQFFTFYMVVFSSYVSLAAMYRAIGSWSPNLSVSRFTSSGLLPSLTLPAGRRSLRRLCPLRHPVGRWICASRARTAWLGSLSSAFHFGPCPELTSSVTPQSSWMRRISVPSYALEALLANEFRTRTLICSGSDLVPSGPSYIDLAFQGCTIQGGVAGSAIVSGSSFLYDKYRYEASHIWRNVGIIYAFTGLYTIFIILGSNLLIRDSAEGASGGKIFKRGAKVDLVQTTASRPAYEEKPKDFANVSGAFTFKNVTYSVPVDGKDKVLLNGITGFVKPGRLCALMGASGAGKTTLLDTIAGRKTTGKVGGELLVDGAPLPSDFSRRTGFVQQGDIHEPFSTVREALQFSALLRQTGRSREEKLAYAEEVIELLECVSSPSLIEKVLADATSPRLQPIADALVGNAEVGGLGIEERKRLTLGVELAARPDGVSSAPPLHSHISLDTNSPFSLQLLFLDERTSFRPWPDERC